MCRSYYGRSLTIFHRVTDGNCHGPTTAAGLPLHPSSKSNNRGGGGVNSCQRFLRVHNFDCVWRLNLTVGKCFTICALDVCAQCDKCLSVGVYEFSSPAMEPGHVFMMSNFALEFEYLVGGFSTGWKRQSGDGTGGIVIYPNSGRQPQRFCVCGHDFNFGFGALNATGLAVEASIGSTITLHVQGSRSIMLKVCSALHLVPSYLGFHVNPSQKLVVNICPTMC